MYIKGVGEQEAQSKLGGTCTVRMGWKLKVTVRYNQELSIPLLRVKGQLHINHVSLFSCSLKIDLMKF